MIELSLATRIPFNVLLEHDEQVLITYADVLAELRGG